MRAMALGAAAFLATAGPAAATTQPQLAGGDDFPVLSVHLGFVF